MAVKKKFEACGMSSWLWRRNLKHAVCVHGCEEEI
jgi:hypothetical protein